MGERPHDFRLNYGHQLAHMMVLAGFGRHENSAHFWDSSLYNSHGTLTNMDIPATATSGWVWSNELGRWGVVTDGSDDTIRMTSSIVGTGDATVSCWLNILGVGESVNSRIISNGKFDVRCSGSVTALKTTSNGTVTELSFTAPTGLFHLAVVRNAATAQSTVYANGVVIAGPGNTAVSPGETTLYLGGSPAVTNRDVNAMFFDAAVHHRLLSESEIRVLANRSDSMLGGLILPPRRRLFGAVSATTNRRRRVLIAGVRR